jgi:hypothetical protein
MTDPEIARRQRCRALQVAIALGIFFPIYTRTWPSLIVAVIGVGAAGVVYWRTCRGR